MHTEMDSRDNAGEAEVAVDEDFSQETVVISETDNVGDVSVEINVEELVAEIEAAQDDDGRKNKEIRRRLEEIQEKKRAAEEFEDTFDIDLDQE
jgi:hypothetical protein